MQKKTPNPTDLTEFYHPQYITECKYNKWYTKIKVAQ